MTAEPLLALPRPAQSGRVSSPRPARLNRDRARTPGLARTKRARAYSRQEVVNHPRHPADTGNSRLTAPSQVDAFGRQVDAHTRDRPSPRGQKTHKLQEKPSVGLEPTTPSLPWKVQGFTSVHGCSLAGTNCLQIARSMSERPRRPEYGRGETGGRNVDGKPAALHRRISRANLGLTRLIAGGPLGPPDAIEQSSITWLAWRSALRGGRGERSRSLAR